jgi:integrase/recombinase XerD
MITYKVVLDYRRAKSRGKYPIMFRVTSNRQTSNYSSGIAVLKGHWNAEASLVTPQCPNYRELNRSLTTKFLRVQKIILQLEADGNFSFETLKKLIQDKPPTKTNAAIFKSFADQLIAEMHEVKRTGNALVYQTAVNRVIGFSGKEHLTFEQIDYMFLESFKNQLVKDGVKTNTVGNYFRSIRAIYNKAIKAKLVDRGLYPFISLTIRTERTAKRALSIVDIQKVYNSAYHMGSPQWHARNYFLLSYSLRGVSFTDLAYLTKQSIRDGRLRYSRKKTGSQLNIALLPLAYNIINLYAEADNKYLLPIFLTDFDENGLAAKSKTRQWIKTTNKWLRRIATDVGIDAELTTYVARHTWATSAKRLGYSNELIAECLGHQYGNKITNIYLDTFDQSVIDEVNEKVVSSIL